MNEQPTPQAILINSALMASQYCYQTDLPALTAFIKQAETASLDPLMMLKLKFFERTLTEFNASEVRNAEEMRTQLMSVAPPRSENVIPFPAPEPQQQLK